MNTKPYPFLTVTSGLRLQGQNVCERAALSDSVPCPLASRWGCRFRRLKVGPGSAHRIDTIFTLLTTCQKSPRKLSETTNLWGSKMSP